MKVFNLLIAIFLMYPLHAQTTWDFKDEIKFYRHLKSSKLYIDTEIHLNTLLTRKDFNSNQIDSLQFYLGLLYYENKQTLLAIKPLSTIQNQKHPYYERARFTEAFLRSYNKSPAQSDNVLISFEPSSKVLKELQLFQLSVNSILYRNYKRFDSLESQLSKKFYSFSKPIENIKSARIDLSNFKKKSTFLAGSMSAMIPGSGKIYAGKLGEGIASFLQCTFLGLQTLEAWNRKPTIKGNPRFWIYGGLFSAFYIGNIWGSVLSVHIRRKEFYDTIDNSIYVDMHIPLRTIFR